MEEFGGYVPMIRAAGILDKQNVINLSYHGEVWQKLDELGRRSSFQHGTNGPGCQVIHRENRSIPIINWKIGAGMWPEEP